MSGSGGGGRNGGGKERLDPVGSKGGNYAKRKRRGWGGEGVPSETGAEGRQGDLDFGASTAEGKDLV